VLILSIHNDQDQMKLALAKGADGYRLRQDADLELSSAISIIRREGNYLCPFRREAAA
jgi:two-component system, NarL family, response regulator NreC